MENKGSSIKVNYINDIHLDFYVRPRGDKGGSPIETYEDRVREFSAKLLGNSEKGDILIISGDLGHDNVGNYYMLKYFSENFDYVIFTYGNHDMYVGKGFYSKDRFSDERVWDLYERIKDLTNVKFLGLGLDNLVYYKDFKIGGACLIGLPTTPKEKDFYVMNMNDYNYINLSNGFNYLSGLRKTENGLRKSENGLRKGAEAIEDEWDSLGFTTVFDRIKRLSDLEDKYVEELVKGGIDIFVSHYPIIYTESHHKFGEGELGSFGSYHKTLGLLPARFNFFGHVHERNIYENVGYYSLEEYESNINKTGIKAEHILGRDIRKGRILGKATKGIGLNINKQYFLTHALGYPREITKDEEELKLGFVILIK